MEALVGYTNTVKFVVPNDLTSATFTVFNGETQVGGTLNAAVDDGLATATLPYATSQTEATIRVVLRFNYQSVLHEPEKTVDVVTPYLEVHEIKDIIAGVTEDKARKVESAVRHIINAHCGQSFGYRKDHVVVVEAHGEGALRLPQRLVELKGLSTLTAVLNPLSAIVVSDGWYLKKGWSEEVSVIESDSTYWGGSDVENDVLAGEPGYEKTGHGHIIYAPTSGPKPTPWKDDYPFTITGDWGYKQVPLPVKEAASLLVSDYSCNEVAYRDKYLESITAADWRLQFNSRSWEYTGNVRADQLLSEFVLLDWAII